LGRFGKAVVSIGNAEIKMIEPFEHLAYHQLFEQAKFTEIAEP
jgi:hypothetical protein